MTSPATATPAPPPAAARRAELSEALGDAAARMRFSNRRRRFDASFSDRRRSRAARVFAIAAFMALVALPGAVAALYFGWLAADRYVAEARFVLKPSRPTLAVGVGAARPIEVTRDTMVLAEFLESRALADALEAGAGLRARMTAPPASLAMLADPPSPDWWAGLAADATAEDLHDYWRAITEVGVERRAGIVTFRVRAFTPGDAQTLALAALAEAEALVNAMNARVWSDAVARGETLFAEAADRLAGAQAALALARNEEGVLDAEAAAALMGSVAAGARSDLIALEREYAAMTQTIDVAAPQAEAMARRIASVRGQIAAIEASMTQAVMVEGAGDGGAEGTRTLSDAMGRFAALETERLFAEKQFLSAAVRLEAMREASGRQLLYLDVFEPPGLAEEPDGPRRALWTAGVLGGGIALWAIATGLFSLVRNHIA